MKCYPFASGTAPAKGLFVYVHAELLLLPPNTKRTLAPQLCGMSTNPLSRTCSVFPVPLGKYVTLYDLVGARGTGSMLSKPVFHIRTLALFELSTTSPFGCQHILATVPQGKAIFNDLHHFIFLSTFIPIFENLIKSFPMTSYRPTRS